VVEGDIVVRPVDPVALLRDGYHGIGRRPRERLLQQAPRLRRLLRRGRRGAVLGGGAAHRRDLHVVVGREATLVGQTVLSLRHRRLQQKNSCQPWRTLTGQARGGDPRGGAPPRPGASHRFSLVWMTRWTRFGTASRSIRQVPDHDGGNL
jgi:hypothetical protein